MTAAFASMAILPGKIGSLEFLIVLFVILLLFGPKYLPRLGKSLGKTINGFKEGLNTDEENTEKISAKKDEEEI